MAQWGNTDDAANSVLWAVAQYNKTANTTTQANFFGNTTADAFVTGATVGQFGVDTTEAQANPDITHAGWVVRTVGSGGRAGRITYETLVASSTITGDAEDVAIPDYVLRFTTQPSDTTANTSASENATFTVVARSRPTGATLGYQWTYANGSTIQAGANVGNTTLATLTINSAVQTSNASFKVEVSATGAANIVSSNATLTITT